MRLAGSFMIKGTAAFDTAKLDRDFSLELGHLEHVPDHRGAARRSNVEQFKKRVQATRSTRPTAKPTDARARARGREAWVPYGTISKFMEVAVLTTEDGGFHRHHGFDDEAIRNSHPREPPKSKRFVRGASTLSMQLAKNLYLDRAKNLSRKLQEAVLTMYLEQELTKEQIVELYLNVVEFGPRLYGIGPAARTYFSTSPADLSIGQALYISSILPNPKVAALRRRATRLRRAT